MSSKFRLASSLSLLAGVAVFFTACLGTGTMEVRPERLYEAWPTEPATYRKVGQLEVTRRGFVFLGFPVAVPNLVATIDSEVQKANADAVTNLEVQTRLYAVALIFASSSYTARGDLIVFE